MKFELEEYHRNIPKIELINDLKRVGSMLGKTSITTSEYNKHGKFHSSTLMRRFDNSWLKTLKVSGLQKTRNYNTSEEDYFMNLEAVWERLGRQPHYSDMTAPYSKYSGRGYWHKFGSWRKALERFIEYVNAKQILSVNKTNTLDNIKSKHKTKRDISWRFRFIVMKRDNFRCKLCGRSLATDSKILLHVDHIIPYSKGGETALENLRTLCSQCNIGKSNL